MDESLQKALSSPDIKKQKKVTKYIGNRFFFKNGKFSILPTSIGLPITLLIITYGYIQQNILIISLLSKYDRPTLIWLLVFLSFFYISVLLLVLFTASKNPGFYLPNKSTSTQTQILMASIKGQEYMLKFCKTCNIFKDLRVHHCRTCNLCVLRHDHHCLWLSTCIGVGNHRCFILMLFSGLIYCIYHLAILSIILKQNKEKLTNMYKAQVIVLLVVVLICFIFVSIVFILHMYNITRNQTTSEKIKRKNNATNPFNTDSLRENFIEFWFNPLFYRLRIVYNANAIKILNLNKMIEENMEDYEETQNNKNKFGFLDEFFVDRQSLSSNSGSSNQEQKNDNSQIKLDDFYGTPHTAEIRDSLGYEDGKDFDYLNNNNNVSI